MTAPQLRSVRRDVNELIGLLTYVLDNIEDLHLLAYDRHRAAEDAKVNGGSRDYALDTHGDPEARRVYRQTATDLRHLILKGTAVAVAVRDHLAPSLTSRRRDRTADANRDEIREAIEAQTRRERRGEYTPTRQVEQQVPLSQTDWRSECQALRSAVAKVTPAFQADHQHCHTDDRRKPRRRYQLNLLTPKERDAWRRAVQSVSDQQAS